MARCHKTLAPAVELHTAVVAVVHRTVGVEEAVHMEVVAADIGLEEGTDPAEEDKTLVAVVEVAGNRLDEGEDTVPVAAEDTDPVAGTGLAEVADIGLAVDIDLGVSIGLAEEGTVLEEEDTVGRSLAAEVAGHIRPRSLDTTLRSTACV